MRFWIVVGLVVGMAHAAFAFQDDNSVNTSGHHNDVTVGGTHVEGDVEQRQTQLQGQVAVAHGGTAAQSSDQANAQSVSVAEDGQQRDHVQSSPTLYLGAAQEGLALGTPWGNASLGQQSEVSRIGTCASLTAAHFDHQDVRVQDLLNACQRAAKRCGVLCRVWRLIH